MIKQSEVTWMWRDRHRTTDRVLSGRSKDDAVLWELLGFVEGLIGLSMSDRYAPLPGRCTLETRAHVTCLFGKLRVHKAWTHWVSSIADQISINTHLHCSAVMNNQSKKIFDRWIRINDWHNATVLIRKHFTNVESLDVIILFQVITCFRSVISLTFVGAFISVG